MRRLTVLLAALLISSQALAGGQTTTAVPSSGSTNVSGFTCFSTAFCNAHVIINNAGTELATGANPLRIDPTGTTTQPVSGTVAVTGTFWQATQPISGTVTTTGGIAQGATTSGLTGGLTQAAVTTAAPSYSTGTTNPLSMDLSGELRVVAPTGQLMTSGATAPGVDPGVGLGVLCQNGGSPTVSAAQTVSLQCNGTGQLITTAGNVAQGAAISGLTGPMLQGEYLAAAPTYSTATVNPLLTDINGNLNVNVAAGSAANSAASATGSAVPVNAGYTGIKVGSNLVGATGTTVSSTNAVDVNLALVNGVAAAVGHGVAATAQRVELPTDGTGQVAISQVTPGTTNGVSPVLTATGGWTPLRLAALQNTATAIKASAGQLGMLYCYNPNATVAYAQVYNTASGSVTVGTTAAVLTIGIPATNNGGFPMNFPGIQFSTAISVAVTTTATGAGNPTTPVDCSAAFN